MHGDGSPADSCFYSENCAGFQTIQKRATIVNQDVQSRGSRFIRLFPWHNLFELVAIISLWAMFEIVLAIVWAVQTPLELSFSGDVLLFIEYVRPVLAATVSVQTVFVIFIADSVRKSYLR